MALAATLAAGALPLQAGAQTPSPGDGILYIGTYGQEIVRVDEATGRVLEPIRLQTGIPRSMQLSEDRSRFYVLDASYEQVEVVDIRSRRSLEIHSLSRGPEQVRIWNWAVDPRDRYLILLVKSYRRLPDRYQVSGPMLLRYDLARRTVSDTLPWPGGEEREGARIVFSPDGELVYFFAEDAILALETDGFTEVDRWEYGTALDDGMGRFDFGFPQQYWSGPGEMTGLFRVTDPVVRRRTMGVATVRLAEREVEYFTLGPSENVSFVLAPDGRKAYGLQQEVGNWHFWTFDLENRRVERRDRFPGRPRMSLLTSSSGEMLYIYNAGNTIDRYEAATYRLIDTIQLPGDNTTNLFILPREGEDRQ